MSVSATTTVGVALTGDIQGSLVIPATNNATSPGQRQVVTLAAGANTLTPPTGARQAVLVPPAGSTNGKTLKGVTGDTGVPIDTANPTVVSLPATPGTFVITSVGTETLEVFWL